MIQNRGIIYLAFGKEFDKLTAATAKYSRKYTDLPMCVFTNLEDRSSVWSEVSDVQFTYFGMSSEENRRIKVSLIKYTPFEESLFMDSDAIIQRSGIECLFNYLDNFDIACQYFSVLKESERKKQFIQKTYAKLADLLGEKFPIELYGEAALLFKKSDEGFQFFDLWYKYWEMMGCGRDMPAFSFAVKHLSNFVKVFRDDVNDDDDDNDDNDVKFCTNKLDSSYFIQHKGFKGFEQRFNLPKYIDWNPKL
jgi:hypothetical protein